MKLKKITALVLALSLLLTLCACSAEQKPEVTLVVKCPVLPVNTVGKLDAENSEDFLSIAAERFCASYKKADVNIRVDVFDLTEETEAVVDAYGTEDAVDVLYEGYFNMSSYVTGGHVVSLDEIISDELRNDISRVSWEQSMRNGKTYMMPFLSMQNVMCYNKDLFKACGLERFFANDLSIQNWTLEEWETILDTLAENLPENSYPMMMYGDNDQGDTHIMTLLRSHGGKLFDSDGNFSFESSEVVDSLKWIQTGVSRGWYAPHPELLEMMDNYNLFLENRLALYMCNNANFQLYDNMTQKYGFVNFPGNIATSFITGFAVFDNGDAAKVQVAKDFVRFIYEDEELLSVSAGNIPESKKMAAEYENEITMLSEFSSNAENVIDFMNGNTPNWRGVRNVFWKEIHELLAGRITPEECAVNLDRECNAAIQVDTSLHD